MKTVEEYLELPYTIALTFDRHEDGNEGYVAEVLELPGCISQGDTPDDAVESVRNAMLGWISIGLEDGHDIPEPGRTHSGKFQLRIPSGLHARLAREAEREGVSLNQFAAAALAGAVGWRAESAGSPQGTLRELLVEAFRIAALESTEPTGWAALERAAERRAEVER